ncbi:MAG: hypothetical protein HND40_16045 [Ignavibacteriota bacterium]|nr:hypothetical protein [Ignavibacteriota bacterium]MCZ2267825.1 hypothetical protein [Ignavibacteriales bacterium]QKK00971.1 MAG: hypothetical protein HND40_16045 [Ignavibacteriota bacterium]HOJ07790.1 hypothetical protein [Ignavibacteriaceae bacterium]
MYDKPLGFEYQPDYEGSCGAYALGHALNLVAITGEIDNFKNSSNYTSITRSVKKNLKWYNFLNRNTYQKISSDVGTSERGILSGIKKAKCTSVLIDNYSETESQKLLDEYLDNGSPVILYANWDKNEEDDGHWYVCAGKSGDKYIIIDSAPLLASKGVISLYAWIEISRRSIVFDEDSSYFQLYGFAVQPKDNISAVPHLHKVLPQLFRDEPLREWWGYYLEDLRYIFDKTETVDNVISSKDFFTKYSRTFIENVSFWNPDVEKSRIQKELNNYSLVAETYNFALSKSRMDEALISFTVALTTASQVE